MRWAIVVVLVSSFGRGQSLLEHSAAAAGGSVGGVAGKKVSDGLTAIFGKIDQQTRKAAKVGDTTPKANPNAPLFEVGPAVTKPRNAVPPPPPPIHRAAVHKAPPLPTRHIVPVPVAPQPDMDPPRQASLTELRSVTSGMSRADVLKLGTPSVRITMNDEGHLLEIYRYVDNSKNLGTLRLTDGSVSNVQVR